MQDAIADALLMASTKATADVALSEPAVYSIDEEDMTFNPTEEGLIG